ncbi:MAG: leucine-rich repeat domain-containing protein [Candidatus Poribacteria bacterium]|nr:leucine-rich repeat domain-containing protein [Candidatus Poribacteria bacterium]
MKTTLYCLITLLTFFGQITLPHSSAQIIENLPHNSVRVIYFLPKDRQPQAGIDTNLDALVKNIQTFYADEMERHGFGRKTFRLETGKTGQVVIHHVKGKSSSSRYNNSISVAVETVIPEIKQRYDTSSNTYLIVADLGQSLGGYAFQGYALTTPRGDFNELNWQEAGYQFIMTAHELGHCFGLYHDFRNDAYIMSYGGRPDTLSKCAAGFLDVHSYFNVRTPQVNNTDRTMQMLPPTLASPDAIRLRFKTNDPRGLHQVQLIIRVDPTDPNSDFELNGCHFFENESKTIEFVSTELIIETHDKVELRMIDKGGGITSQTFPIDISNILPPPKIVSILDPNLEASIREALGLNKNDPISQRALLGLKNLNARDRQIKNLSGLEHATQLRYLYLGDFDGNDANNNNVSDLTPLKNLTKLKQLWLGDNNVSDLTPLKNLTELDDLSLFLNNVSDLTPLKNLTQLRELKLGRNPVSDLTPLKNLTNLVRLSLYVVNNVSDITPLRNMTKLKVLTVSSNNVRDITSLKNLTDLEHLNLSFIGNVSDLTPLKNLTQLKHLNLSRNQVSDLMPLENLTNLDYLNLSHNNVSNITPLINLTNLEVLRLEGNPIKNHARLLTLLKKKPDMKIYLKEGGEPLPVTLSHFRAERTPAGVVLKWITESEIDNAGFYVYRSQARNGEFKVVNPTLIPGAGTTGERHTYMWTDTTAKPNVVYYYRIEDVSHAGVRKQLATVRMRGLVSASGKLTTIWVDLKTR